MTTYFVTALVVGILFEVMRIHGNTKINYSWSMIFYYLH